MKKTFATLCLCAVASAISAAPLSAQVIYPVAVTGSAENESTIYDITTGHTVILSKSVYLAMRSSVPDSPVNGLAGPCFGMMEVKAGVISGDGYCNYNDADGERAVIQWKADTLDEDGTIRGDWVLVGGSGKWVGATGGGEFQSHTARKTGRTTNSIRGEIRLE